jgi:hypothetical protein
MTIPLITVVLDPPEISDPVNFEVKADALLNEGLPDLCDQMNNSIDGINEAVDDINTVFASAGFYATSTTSNTIGTGAKTFFVAPGLGFRKGAFLIISDAAASTVNWLFAQIDASDPATGQLDVVVAADDAHGSGTKTSWVLTMSGPKGVTGGIGKHSIPVPAAAMISATTNGAAAGRVETTTNKVMLASLDFDPSTAETAQFSIPMPKAWNEGTVTFRAIWRHGATTTNYGVAWGLSAMAVSDDDPLDVAFGTEVIVTDTGGTTNDLYTSAESAALTVAGTPAASDVVFFKVRRVVADAADTLAIDASLLHLAVFITTDAGNDA